MNQNLGCLLISLNCLICILMAVLSAVTTQILLEILIVKNFQNIFMLSTLWTDVTSLFRFLCVLFIYLHVY